MIVAALVFPILNPMIALVQTSFTLAASADQPAYNHKDVLKGKTDHVPMQARDVILVP